jgi:hypothetical protein
VLRKTRIALACSLVILLASSLILIAPYSDVYADSSDVSDCSESFSGTLSEPFNAETTITINSVSGDYDVEFDYVVTIGDEGSSFFSKQSALEPAVATFVEGETISMVLTSSDVFIDGAFPPVVLYHKDISDCEILFDSSSIPETKRQVLSIVITEQEPSKFLVKATIPDTASATDFTKLVIAYSTNPDASVSYTVGNVSVVDSDNVPPVFCGRNIEDFDNIIYGTAKSNKIIGTQEDDLIRGFGGDDRIAGKSGDDCIIGNGGDDILRGGPGDDSIYAGEGDDDIYGNDGRDLLYGNDGEDLISGGKGDDYIAGKSGNDSLFGNGDNDKMFGNEGEDFIKGGNGNDIMFGGDGFDKLFGNTGSDRMSGQGGDDELLGGRGDDRLNGGEGSDLLDGGKNRDKCADDDATFLNCEEVTEDQGRHDKSYDLDVLVISYFPLTEDGMLDIGVTGETFLEGLTHEQIRQRTIDITNNFIGAVAEATTYLGYEDTSAEPAITYHVSETIEHLEAVPIAPRPGLPLYPDYPGIMTEHDICDLVDNGGIDEIWIWAYQGFPVEKLAISESRMAGPFGDISNSFRFNDMPVCASSYVVYTFNYARGTAEALENWGHQMEAELDAVDMDNIFRDKFQGPNYPQTLDVTGRCGSVHNPPNARFEYDRNNPTPQLSDCLDWDPNGLGELSEISCDVWGCVDNSDSDNPPLNYMIWNWQNAPGINNPVEYQGKQLRSWWDVYGDFDNVMTNSRTLVIE